MSANWGAPAAISWQPVLLNNLGFVNLGEMFQHGEHISAYAMLRIYSPREQKVAVLVGADDQIRMWLNGNLIHERSIAGSAVVDAETVPATLGAGWNTLLSRVINITGEHAMYLRLSGAK
jgi:hypothetical protein